MELTGEVKDFASPLLEHALKLTSRPRQLMRRLADRQLESTVRNFEAESFDGTPWKPLAKSTAQAFITGTPGRRASRKRKSGKGRTKERGQRRGYANILHPNGRHIRNKLGTEVHADESQVFCAQSWAFVHNEGLRMKHFIMPQRTFLGISKQDEVEIEALLNDFASEIVTE